MARAVAWISRFFLGLLGVRVDRTPDAEEHADVLRGAIDLHGHGQEGETAPAEKAMLQLGARSRRPHGRRRHDPSRQRRADRRRPADGRHRQPDAGSALHAHPGLSQPRPTTSSACVHAKDLFRAVKAAGGPETVKIDGGHDAALVHSRIDDAASTSCRPSAPGTSISPSSSTSTARCAASSPSRTSSRRSSATSRTSTTPSSAAWSGARTAA